MLRFSTFYVKNCNITNFRHFEDKKMSLGMIGQKAGMTRIFDATGISVPVTVISVQPNLITQIKTLEKDGYKPLLTGYLPEYKPFDEPHGRTKEPWMTRFNSFYPHGTIFIQPTLLRDWKRKNSNRFGAALWTCRS